MAKKRAVRGTVPGCSLDEFQEGDYVQVVHDNDPTYVNDRGIVYQLKQYVWVAVAHKGKVEERSYVPCQLKKINVATA